MCGIVAYSGDKKAYDILLQGLYRLEYRGYDSAGICTLNGDHFDIQKKAGRIDALAQLVKKKPPQGVCGISHTRWATHGEPTNDNAHPHLDQSGKLALVHNGVIENYQTLKDKLLAKGHTFHSQTDTEVLAHLIGYHYDSIPESPERLLNAVKKALLEVTGTYGIAVLHTDRPGEIIGARRGSPLILGIGEKELFLASDVTALGAYTQRVIYLNDFDIVQILGKNYTLESLNQSSIDREICSIDWDPESTDKGEHDHFMLKEIFEQPASMENAMRGRLDLEQATAKFGGLNLEVHALRTIDRLIITGCGTALHAGMVGEYIIEELARIPVEIEIASEFRYRNSPLDNHTLAFAISQSGETADTLAAMREVQRKGFRALGICNVVGSTIARESDGGIFLHAGPEIGVAATKSFTSQTLVMALLALFFGRLRHLSSVQGREFLNALKKLPEQTAEILEQHYRIQTLAKKYASSQSMLFFGRQANYPVALEGALKMKEVSYIHAEGYPSAELKHGVIALITEKLPSLVICPQDGVYEKNLSNIQEIKARKGPVIAIGTQDDKELKKLADDVIELPPTHPLLQPILNVIPLQLLAYYTAVHLGRDVDKPRNLAKSVTVE
ncbi:MAG: glutamine--fructose-6-phosphate transaminase (isomerizing) [Verrucomicrobiia bacterium]